MKRIDDDRIEKLLQDAIQPIGANHQPNRDLWLDLRHRIREAPSPAVAIRAIPWFDWALAGGLAIVAVAVPASIPVLFYYL